MLTDSQLSRLLEGIQRPARYIGGEINSVRKDWDAVECRMALAFPDIYEIGMSHLGLQVLYGIANMREDALAERVFMPWFDMEARLGETDTPLFSLEGRRGLREFDILGFSLQYEMCYATTLRMLDMAGIPRRRCEREGGDWPLVIAGGPCAFNPEPLAEFIDVFIVGDGEDALPQLIETWKGHRGGQRTELLRSIAAGVDGAYVPALYSAGDATPKSTDAAAPECVAPACVRDLDSAFFPTAPVVAHVEAVHDRISLELMRGCVRGCRFCQAGMTRRPLRTRSVAKLIELAEESYRNTGHNEISLVSLSTGDYPHLKELAAKLAHRFTPLRVSLAYPSLRADRALEIIPESAGEVRKSALTVAVEAGTDRLRKVVKKGITEEGLLAGTKFAFDEGWNRIKLYFMVGLPSETLDDVAAIAELVEKVIRVGREVGRQPHVNVSVAPFIPKPSTPFQWEPMASRAYLEKAKSLLEDKFRRRPVKLAFHRIDRSIVEAALARGGREAAEAVSSAADAGARLDAWDEGFDFEIWRRAFESGGIDIERYACRRLAMDGPLAWDHISPGVPGEFLARERQRAFEGIPAGE